MVGKLLATVREVIRFLLKKVGVLSMVLERNLLLRLILVEGGSSCWNLPRRVVVSIGIIEVGLAIIAELLCI